MGWAGPAAHRSAAHARFNIATNINTTINKYMQTNINQCPLFHPAARTAPLAPPRVHRVSALH